MKKLVTQTILKHRLLSSEVLDMTPLEQSRLLSLTKIDFWRIRRCARIKEYDSTHEHGLEDKFLNKLQEKEHSMEDLLLNSQLAPGNIPIMPNSTNASRSDKVRSRNISACNFV
jgi:hypothetical protein